MQKIISEMEVAPCNKLDTLRTLHKLLKLVTLFKSKNAIMPLHMIWLYNFMDFMKSWCGGVDHTP